eukprot:TRINITY_DN49072_c0_g1_i1.p1 TRINITY_DN49072_c0_g1~~TRINITY_DN49072_c0_g1_i1.p1  ORF type:complete len:402 (+),score=60.69 TRINITY_DN49072_c0_g1_i1:98-1207(+)
MSALRLRQPFACVAVGLAFGSSPSFAVNSIRPASVEEGAVSKVQSENEHQSPSALVAVETQFNESTSKQDALVEGLVVTDHGAARNQTSVHKIEYQTLGVLGQLAKEEEAVGTQPKTVATKKNAVQVALSEGEMIERRPSRKGFAAQSLSAPRAAQPRTGGRFEPLDKVEGSVVGVVSLEHSSGLVAEQAHVVEGQPTSVKAAVEPQKKVQIVQPRTIGAVETLANSEQPEEFDAPLKIPRRVALDETGETITELNAPSIGTTSSESPGLAFSQVTTPVAASLSSTLAMTATVTAARAARAGPIETRRLEDTDAAQPATPWLRLAGCAGLCVLMVLFASGPLMSRVRAKPPPKDDPLSYLFEARRLQRP